MYKIKLLVQKPEFISTKTEIILANIDKEQNKEYQWADIGKFCFDYFWLLYKSGILSGFPWCAAYIESCC